MRRLRGGRKEGRRAWEACISPYFSIIIFASRGRCGACEGGQGGGAGLEGSKQRRCACVLEWSRGICMSQDQPLNHGTESQEGHCSLPHDHPILTPHPPLSCTTPPPASKPTLLQHTPAPASDPPSTPHAPHAPGAPHLDSTPSASAVAKSLVKDTPSAAGLSSSATIPVMLTATCSPLPAAPAAPAAVAEALRAAPAAAPCAEPDAAAGGATAAVV